MTAISPCPHSRVLAPQALSLVGGRGGGGDDGGGGGDDGGGGGDECDGDDGISRFA